MVPVDEKVVISTALVQAQIESMINTKQILLGMDCKDKNVLGFSYDTGYISALLELKRFIDNPPKPKPEDEEEDA